MTDEHTDDNEKPYRRYIIPMAERPEDTERLETLLKEHDYEFTVTDGPTIGDLPEALQEAVIALQFYANVDTYFAISFLFDPPCGGFREDFEVVPESDYERPMPGKCARSALKSIAQQALAHVQRALAYDARGPA